MFRDSFEKLELAEVATILDQLNDSFEAVEFDPVDTTIMAIALSFYPGYRFLEVANHTVSPSQERFVLYNGEEAVVLDFTNAPIYQMNKDVPIQLTDENVAEYVRFFFTYVKGRHGRFLICENVDDINWKEEPPPAARKAMGKMLKTLDIKSKDGGTYYMEATMVFKDSLFKSDVYVTPEGTVTLKDEELLVEDLPVLDDVFGQ